MIDNKQSKMKLELTLIGSLSSRNNMRASNQIPSVNMSSSNKSSTVHPSLGVTTTPSRIAKQNLTPKRYNTNITGNTVGANTNITTPGISLNAQINNRLQGTSFLSNGNSGIQGKPISFSQNKPMKKNVIGNEPLITCRNSQATNPGNCNSYTIPTSSGLFSQDKMNIVLKNSNLRQKNNQNMHLTHKNQILQHFQQNQNPQLSQIQQNQKELSHQISQLDINTSSPASSHYFQQKTQEQQGFSPSFSSQILDTSHNNTLNGTRLNNSYLMKTGSSGSAISTPSSYLAALETTNSKQQPHNYQKYLQNISKSTKDSSFFGGSIGGGVSAGGVGGVAGGGGLIQTNIPLSSGSISSVTSQNGSKSIKGCSMTNDKKTKEGTSQTSYLKKSQLAMTKNQNNSNLMLNNSQLNSTSFLKQNHSRSPLGSSHNIPPYTTLDKENKYQNQFNLSSSSLSQQQQSSPFSYLEGRPKTNKSPKQSNSLQIMNSHIDTSISQGNSNFFSSHLSRKKNLSTVNYSDNNFTKTNSLLNKQTNPFSMGTQDHFDTSPTSNAKRIQLMQQKNDINQKLLLENQSKTHDTLLGSSSSGLFGIGSNNHLKNRLEQFRSADYTNSSQNCMRKSYLTIEKQSSSSMTGVDKKQMNSMKTEGLVTDYFGDLNMKKIGENQKNFLTMNEHELSFQNEQDDQGMIVMQNTTQTQNDLAPSGYYNEDESNFLNSTNFLNTTNLQMGTQIQKNPNFSHNASQILPNTSHQPNVSTQSNAFNTSVCTNSMLNNTISNILQNMSYNYKAQPSQNILINTSKAQSVMMPSSSICNKLPMDITPQPTSQCQEPLFDTNKCMSMKSVLYDQIMPTIRPIVRQFKLLNNQLQLYQQTQNTTPSIHPEIEKHISSKIIQNIDPLKENFEIDFTSLASCPNSPIQMHLKIDPQSINYFNNQFGNYPLNANPLPIQPSEKDHLIIQEYNFSFSNCVNPNKRPLLQITADPQNNAVEQDNQCSSPQKLTVVEGVTQVSSQTMSLDQTEYPVFTSPNLNADAIFLSNFLPIDAFQIGKCLGRGRFGNVYLSRHKATNMLFAIKQINKKNLIESCMEKQLQQEIKIQTYLNHPNILKMHGYFDDQQKIYLILELASHGDIYKEIKKEPLKRMSEQKAANYIRQVCEGLIYLHNQGIIHRDIKPENILNSYGVLKLSDFGWSIYTEEKRMTFCGTLDYVSPEVVSGKDYDFKVDIWSIGVLTYELITGKPPFENRQNNNEAYQKILMVKYDFPSYISNDAKDFMSKLLVGDPNKRLSLDMALNHEWIIKNTRNCLADWDPKVSEESLYLLK